MHTSEETKNQKSLTDRFNFFWNRLMALGKFIWAIIPEISRKFIIWLGAFAIGCSPAYSLVREFPSPLDLDDFANLLISKGAFEDFLFVAISISGVGILNVLEHAFSGDYPVSQYRLTYVGVLALCANLLLLLFLLLLDYPDLKAGEPMGSDEMEKIVIHVQQAIYSAFAVEMILAFMAARMKFKSKQNQKQGV